MKAPKKILWVDDDIDKLGSYVDALKNYGFNVVTADSTHMALDLAQAERFDVILVDIRMPHPDGIELLRRIHPLQPDAALAALSSYLYLPNYRASLRNLGFDVEIIDKDLPSTDDKAFVQRFIEPISTLSERGVTNSIRALPREKKTVQGPDPFAVEYHDFMRLPILEKDRLVDAAEEMAKDTIEKAFRGGKIWILLCGDSETIRAAALDSSEIMSEEQMLRFAMELNRAPFHFFKEMKTEEMWTSCGAEISLKDYPTVTLRVADRLVDGKNHEFTVHFDTGSPETFFSYEELLQVNAIPPARQFGKIVREGYGRERCNKLELSTIIKCQESGATRIVRLQGRVVREWIRSSFKKICRQHCAPYLRNADQDLCPERKGIVGRNILTDNNLKLILDGAKKKTRLLKEEE